MKYVQHYEHNLSLFDISNNHYITYVTLIYLSTEMINKFFTENLKCEIRKG